MVADGIFNISKVLKLLYTDSMNIDYDIDFTCGIIAMCWR